MEVEVDALEEEVVDGHFHAPVPEAETSEDQAVITDLYGIQALFELGGEVFELREPEDWSLRGITMDVHITVDCQEDTEESAGVAYIITFMTMNTISEFTATVNSSTFSSIAINSKNTIIL